LSEGEAVPVEVGVIKARDGKSARKIAEEWAENNLPITLGETEIVFDARSVKNSLAHGYNQAKLDAITSIPEGFRNAVFLGETKDFSRDEAFDRYYAYPVIYNGERQIVFCRAIKDRNTNRLYVHEVFLEEKIKTDSLQTVAASTQKESAQEPHGGIRLYKEILQNVYSVNEKDVSKVVDENGEPLVVYHGSRTGGRFYEFEQDSFFSDDFETADMFKREADFELYVNGKLVGTVGDEDASNFAYELSNGDYTAEDIADWGDISREDISSSYAVDEIRRLSGYEVSADEIETVRLVPTRGVFNVFLNIRNPLVADYGGKVWMDNDFLPEEKIKEAKKEHDGVVVKNIVEGGFMGEYRGGGEPRPSTDYIPFSPSQIKSATDNVGTFDGGNADIR
ncbi:MAG: hypothetical protein IJW12_03215, partial [Opitutales bacterium]|nr:hypothetical protein [Opitutales bacterium]